MTILSPLFAEQVANLSENALETAAQAWVEFYPSEETALAAPAYDALRQLRTVAQDATARKLSLALRLFGDSN